MIDTVALYSASQIYFVLFLIDRFNLSTLYAEMKKELIKN